MTFESSMMDFSEGEKRLHPHRPFPGAIGDVDADARPGATGPLEEADYRPPPFQHTGEALELSEEAERKANRELNAEREGAAYFEGQRVGVEIGIAGAIQAGQVPLIAYSVLRHPSGQVHVVASIHEPVEPIEIDFAHTVLLDVLRRKIDQMSGAGHAAKMLFLMAADADWMESVAGHQK